LTDEESRITPVDGKGADEPAVQRLHIIDACQASDLPESYKYERNWDSGEHARNIRDGVSLELLFHRVEQTVNKAVARMTLLRWALFQFLVGNCDAHGKNFSFYVHREGLEPAPWYDLVSVVQYPGIDHELAMAWGDAFSLEDVRAFQLADFAQRCRAFSSAPPREALSGAASPAIPEGVPKKQDTVKKRAGCVKRCSACSL